MKLTTDAWKAWQRTAEEIRKDITHMMDDRQIFSEFRQICADNSDWLDKNYGAVFCEFVVRCYATRAIMGVRRHLKLDKDSHSLMRLIEQIAYCSNQLTFDCYLSRFPQEAQPFWQKGTFGALSDDGKVISRAIVDGHREKLKSIGAEVESYADRILAHLDKRGFEGPVYLRDIDKCLEHFETITRTYVCFLTGHHRELTPVIQVNWKKIFRHPMIRPMPSE